MGRKSKLKHDKRRAAAAATKMNNNNNNHEASATESAAGVNVKAIPTVNDDTDLDIDHEFPQSDIFVQLEKSLTRENCNAEEVDNELMRGAKEYGCVHSMYMISQLWIQPHFGQPWLLEASILGSIFCVSSMLEHNFAKATPCQPKALATYWMKMQAKYEKWGGSTPQTRPASPDKLKTEHGDSNMKDIAKELKGRINRVCIICLKTDTETLALRQCMGCSTYCYCSKICQTRHWEEPQHNHRAECKQLKILNKYHKPYAKEIRKAAIRGDTTHPALEKLRHKLGLSRPTQDYQDFSNHNTHEGKTIDPYEYVVAREDGTVWIGSTPSPIGPFSSDSDTDTGTCTATTTITDVMSMKVGAMKTELKGYGICTDTFIEKSEFVDALRKARNDTLDCKPKSTVV